MISYSSDSCFWLLLWRSAAACLIWWITILPGSPHHRSPTKELAESIKVGMAFEEVDKLTKGVPCTVFVSGDYCHYRYRGSDASLLDVYFANGRVNEPALFHVGMSRTEGLLETIGRVVSCPSKASPGPKKTKKGNEEREKGTKGKRGHSLNKATQVQDALGDLTTTVFDAAGNVTATIDAGGDRTTMGFDLDNRQTQRGEKDEKRGRSSK